MGELRTCPLCLKPAALQSCCPLGKIPPAEWSLEHMLIFLDVLKTTNHKWSKFGSLGDMVDAPLSQGGYKEIFKKERLTGRAIIGKQRKTISDTMKRFGIGNVKHRDLICESLYDLSKPMPKVAEEAMLEELSILVKNSWTNERRPDIQLQALTDILRISVDPEKHQTLMKLGLAETLMDIVSGPMMDPTVEKALEQEQKEINHLKLRGKKNELGYDQKKELDRKELQQARLWIQCKADFGSLAVTSYCVLQNLSITKEFKERLASERFCDILIRQLVLFKEAEKNLDFLRNLKRGQYLNLVTSEVAEQQAVTLSIILNLSSETAYKIILVNQGIAKAVIELAASNAVRDSPVQLKCLQILNSLSLTNGRTEELLVKDGVLDILTPVLRHGLDDILMLAIATLSHLAFVPSNSKAIIDAGVLIPLSNILKRGRVQHRSKAIEVIRNLSAGGVDERLVGTVISDLVRIIHDDDIDSEQKLRCFIALRSLARFEQSLQAFHTFGVLKCAHDWARGSDSRIRIQAVGLLVNVLGNTVITPMESEEEDDLSDGPEDEEQFQLEVPNEMSVEKMGFSKQVQNITKGPVLRACKAMQLRRSPFLRLLTEEESLLLATECQYIYVPKDVTLAAEGEHVGSLFVVIKGIFRVLLNASVAKPGEDHNQSRSTDIGVSTSSKIASRFGKSGYIEILRLRSGDTACELNLLENKACAATIVALTDCVVLDVQADRLIHILSKRKELTNFLTPGEKAILPVRDQLRKLWSHPSISDELCEKVNLSKIELSHVRTKMHKSLLQMDSLALFQDAQDLDDLSGIPGKLLIKVGIALLIGGPDTKDQPILETDDEIVIAMKETVDAMRSGKEWHGHRYQVNTLLLAARLMVLNDKNKRKFIRCNMIPWLLRLVKSSPHEDEIRLATSTLLLLSFAMRARWLLRPVMLLWHRHMQQENRERSRKINAPLSTKTVDVAAPVHTEDEEPIPVGRSFEIELHEAASEGGVQWMQRLLTENGVDPNVRDTAGASAMHFAALSGRKEAMMLLLQRQVDINVQDAAGCTPLSWFIMARQTEFGIDANQWPERWKILRDWLLANGAEAHFVRAFPFSV